MIHKTRKREGKDNSIIYGVATDNFDYRFWRIDNNSDVGPIYHYYLQILRNRGDIFDQHIRME